MKRQLWKAFFTLLGAVVGLVLASSVQAQDPEVFLMSYPNANITVDGDASDWDLSKFGTFVVGGVAAEGLSEEWERVTGTGDIARLGWDDGEQDVFYGSMWTGAVLPEGRVDNSVKFYARDNATHQYFLADITDDEINADDEAAWANDSVEFYIDPENDRGAAPDWNSDVQLVIDANNRVQVWNSPIDYAEQVEAGVVSAITFTDTGWLLEVGIDKSVFDSPLPAVLGPANDQEGNNYGIDLSYRDNDDPDEIGSRNGDPFFSTNYIWADPTMGGGFPSKVPDNWGQMIAGVEIDVPTPLQAGDADMDLDFDQLDLVQVQIAATYLSGKAATWGEGDWNGAPGGEQGNPPAGNGLFDQLDIIAALGAGHYLTGPYAAINPGGEAGDDQTSIVYNATTGEVGVDAPAGTELTSVNIQSAASVFTGDSAQNLGGSFDNDADDNIFKATFGSSFGSLSFGNVAQTGLSEDFVAGDLTVVGSLAGGGDLGPVDLIYVPEPSTMALLGPGLVGALVIRRRRSS